MKVLDVVSPLCVSEVHKSSKQLDVIKTGFLFFKNYDFGALGVKLANPCWQTLEIFKKHLWNHHLKRKCDWPNFYQNHLTTMATFILFSSAGLLYVGTFGNVS